MVKILLPVGVLAGLAAGCKPNLDDTVSIVLGPRVLAVRSELAGATPVASEAEAKPTETIGLRALFVDPFGDPSGSPPALDWAFCDARKPLAELGPVNPSCLDVASAGLVPLGMGDAVTGAIPRDACQQFGPDAPQPQKGMPAGRPVDPDPTGGYYVPARLVASGPAGPMLTLGETRVLCTLASFSPDVVAAFQQRYHRNVNPEVATLGIKDAAAPWTPTNDAGGAPNAVGAGQRLALEVSWPTCPTADAPDDGVCGPDETGTPCGTCGDGVAASRADCCVDTSCLHAHGCAGAERYVVLDAATGTLVARREGIAVAWYATGGTFTLDRTGRGNDDLATTSDDTWRAPDTAGPVTMWIVVRDERGGVGWKQYALDVR